MTAKNRIVRSVARKSIFEDARNVIDATVNIEQGDLIALDTASNLLVPLVLEASGLTMLGISDVTLVSGKVKSPYQGTAVDAAQALESVPGPQYGVEAKMKLKSGDAFTPGALVYGSTDPQEVQESGTKAIGVYQGAAIASAPSGTEGEVLVGARYPGDVLQF